MPTKPITIRVIDRASQHFVATFHKPGRIEVSVTPGGGLIVFAYEGAKVDPHQEPDAVFDGTEPPDRFKVIPALGGEDTDKDGWEPGFAVVNERTDYTHAWFPKKKDADAEAARLSAT